MEFESYSAADTFNFGRLLGEKLTPGTVITLSGDLGCGKTVLAKGIAKGLGITSPVSSPTFTVVKEYRQGRIPLFHFDAYRIADEDEMFEIGFDEYLDAGGAVVIEWPENIKSLIPAEAVSIELKKDYEKGDDVRIIMLKQNIDENTDIQTDENINDNN